MDWRVKAALGVTLTVVGVLGVLNYVGIYFIADCGPDCVARGERLVVVALAFASAAVAGAGIWLTRKAVRGRPPAPS